MDRNGVDQKQLTDWCLAGICKKSYDFLKKNIGIFVNFYKYSLIYLIIEAMVFSSGASILTIFLSLM